MRIEKVINKFLEENWTSDDEYREQRGGPAPDVSKGRRAAVYFESFLKEIKKDIERKHRGSYVNIDLSGDVITLSIIDDDDYHGTDGQSFTIKVLQHRNYGQ